MVWNVGAASLTKMQRETAGAPRPVHPCTLWLRAEQGVAAKITRRSEAPRVDRRELLGWMVATGGLAALERLAPADLLAIGRDAHRTTRAPADPARTLDARAAAIVTRVADHIIPASDTPGASDAGVTTFVDHMLGAWYPSADRDRFLAGLDDLDARSRARGVESFVALDAAAQLALLEVIDGDVTGLRTARDASANRHWFAMMKYLTVWGYCTSERGMRETLHTWPMPMRYDGNAAVK